MPSCYMCQKETPVTRFYLLRIFNDEVRYTWYYACGVKCLKLLVTDKVYDNVRCLLREYMDTCGKAWEFNGYKLKEFVASMV